MNSAKLTLNPKPKTVLIKEPHTNRDPTLGSLEPALQKYTPCTPIHELLSKLLKRDYIGDYLGDYYKSYYLKSLKGII